MDKKSKTNPLSSAAERLVLVPSAAERPVLVPSAAANAVYAPSEYNGIGKKEVYCWLSKSSLRGTKREKHTLFRKF